MSTAEPPNTIIAGADRATDPSIRTFETLDGLRGVAAISVLLWHLHVPLLNSAYLAVDLFFMLSGFVIAYRYEHRLRDGMQGLRFMLMRMIRLYPLYLLGSLLGVAWNLSDILLASDLTSQLLKWGVKFGFAILMCPNIFSNVFVFAFNAPAWSLFYEVVVNAIYGFTVRRTTDAILTIIILLSALGLAAAVVEYGNMHFTVEMPEFLLGGVRAIFGFYVGIGIFRLHARGLLPHWRIPPLLIAALLVLLLAVPRFGTIAVPLTLVVVFIGFPALIVMALSNEPSGAVARVFNQLGLLSFPVYAIHYPLFAMVAYFATKLSLAPLTTSAIAIGLSLLLAWLAMRYFDKPVRHLLTVLVERHMHSTRSFGRLAQPHG